MITIHTHGMGEVESTKKYSLGIGIAYHDSQWGSEHGDQRRHAHAANEQLPHRLVEQGDARVRNEREREDH